MSRTIYQSRHPLRSSTAGRKDDRLDTPITPTHRPPNEGPAFGSAHLIYQKNGGKADKGTTERRPKRTPPHNSTIHKDSGTGQEDMSRIIPADQEHEVVVRWRAATDQEKNNSGNRDVRLPVCLSVSVKDVGGAEKHGGGRSLDENNNCSASVGVSLY